MFTKSYFEDKILIFPGQPTLQTPPSQRPIFWSDVVQVPSKLAASHASRVVLQRRQGPGQLVELQVTCSRGVHYVMQSDVLDLLLHSNSKEVVTQHASVL